MQTIAWKEGSVKLSTEVRYIEMKDDDETIETQLHKLLTSQGISITFYTIIRCRSMLGWTLSTVS